jgi:glyoxylase-like metal-dependent hydrolase (beta-lactamase superfamily II)
LRVLALHADAIVFISRVWQTTCTAIREGDEGFLIDSPVYPDELEALASVLEQARFPLSGLLATHGDWDHLLGRLAFPSASLGCGEATANRLRSDPGVVQRELRAFDQEHYVVDRRPLSLAGIQSLPVPGRLALGSAGQEIQLHPTDGHTCDGAAFWAPWLKILVCGDYLSPVEIPMISAGGSISAYRSTLERLGPLVEQAETVVPGHGGALGRADAARLLEEDSRYLATLDASGGASLPAGRRTEAQLRIHQDNVRRVS